MPLLVLFDVFILRVFRNPIKIEAPRPAKVSPEPSRNSTNYHAGFWPSPDVSAWICNRWSEAAGAVYS